METLLTTDACTMPTVDRPTRVAEFDALFADHVTAVRRDGETVHLHLSGPAGLEATVRDLVDRESACCSFFTFVVSGGGEDVVLQVSVPPARREILDSLAERASELSA